VEKGREESRQGRNSACYSETGVNVSFRLKRKKKNLKIIKGIRRERSPAKMHRPLGDTGVKRGMFVFRQHPTPMRFYHVEKSSKGVPTGLER